MRYQNREGFQLTEPISGVRVQRARWFFRVQLHSVSEKNIDADVRDILLKRRTVGCHSIAEYAQKGRTGKRLSGMGAL